MKISGSFLNKNIKAKAIIKEFNNTNLDYIHVDIMDGKFVKNKTWTYGEIKDILKNTTKKLDVHLMCNKPEKYIEDYALLNTEYITFHLEAVKDIENIINLIKNYGVKVGISIKPNTSVNKIIPYLDNIDLILVMSVEPGREGQLFEEKVINKITKLKEYIKSNNLKTIIEVDGGVNNENIDLLKNSGVDIVVSASYIHNGNIQSNINSLR